MCIASLSTISDEICEDVELLNDIFDPPATLRLSARRRMKATKKSPGKKRKRETEAQGEATETYTDVLPGYFQVPVTYDSAADSDYDPEDVHPEDSADSDISLSEGEEGEDERGDTQEDTQEEEDGVDVERVPVVERIRSKSKEDVLNEIPFISTEADVSTLPGSSKMPLGL